MSYSASLLLCLLTISARLKILWSCHLKTSLPCQAALLLQSLPFVQFTPRWLFESQRCALLMSIRTTGWGEALVKRVTNSLTKANIQGFTSQVRD